ncbi:unnamed protein product, partial [Notodromas monacha]
MWAFEQAFHSNHAFKLHDQSRLPGDVNGTLALGHGGRNSKLDSVFSVMVEPKYEMFFNTGISGGNGIRFPNWFQMLVKTSVFFGVDSAPNRWTRADAVKRKVPGKLGVESHPSGPLRGWMLQSAEIGWNMEMPKCVGTFKINEQHKRELECQNIMNAFQNRPKRILDCLSSWNSFALEVMLDQKSLVLWGLMVVALTSCFGVSNALKGLIEKDYAEDLMAEESSAIGMYIQY